MPKEEPQGQGDLWAPPEYFDEEQRQQWNEHLETSTGRTRFGEFEDQIGGWIPAPELPNITLTPR